ncbi:MAG: hypothetical protein Tsb009_06350 [Planctomycetaceae bacterium]
MFLACLVSPAISAEKSASKLPDPDGKPADMSKPVQVFILLGQSNMVGAGAIKPRRGKEEGCLEYAVKEKKLYPYLIDDEGNWTVRKDVRNVRVMGSGGSDARNRLFNNEWMTIKGRTIGPEFGIGHYLGNAIDAPVLILKSCIGNRSLGWDLLPPGSERYEFKMKDRKTGELKTYVYPAYNDKVRYTHWEKGKIPEPPKHNWHAGLQYEGDIARARKVLDDLNKYYPGAKKYEVAGFFFWQGDKDRYNAGHASRYEKNLVQLIKQLRKDFNAPHAKFVCATLGQTKKGEARNENERKILEAQLAVDGKTGKYPEFKGNVATVYTHPLSKGGASNSHYGGNAETYMNVGEAMGRAMVELLKSESK